MWFAWTRGLRRALHDSISMTMRAVRFLPFFLRRYGLRFLTNDRLSRTRRHTAVALDRVRTRRTAANHTEDGVAVRRYQLSPGGSRRQDAMVGFGFVHGLVIRDSSRTRPAEDRIGRPGDWGSSRPMSARGRLDRWRYGDALDEGGTPMH